MGLTLLFISLVYCVVYMLLNLFLFYQVVRPLGRKSVNKYLYLYLYLYMFRFSFIKLVDRRLKIRKLNKQ